MGVIGSFILTSAAILLLPKGSGYPIVGVPIGIAAAGIITFFAPTVRATVRRLLIFDGLAIVTLFVAFVAFFINFLNTDTAAKQQVAPTERSIVANTTPELRLPAQTETPAPRADDKGRTQSKPAPSAPLPAVTTPPAAPAPSPTVLNVPLQSTNCIVSKAQFLALSAGMSYRQAVRALGCLGNEISRSEMLGTVTVMYSWKGSAWSGANMNAMFQNDGLVTKAQFGLTD
jgi:hypothetical protein